MMEKRLPEFDEIRKMNRLDVGLIRGELRTRLGELLARNPELVPFMKDGSPKDIDDDAKMNDLLFEARDVQIRIRWCADILNPPKDETKAKKVRNRPVGKYELGGDVVDNEKIDDGRLPAISTTEAREFGLRV